MTEDSGFTVEKLRAVALARLSFLEGIGFHRTPSRETTDSTGGTVVYLATHVGLIFSLDIRDECVDGMVVRVRDGRMTRNWEAGGYSSNIFTHLVRHAGYRGEVKNPGQQRESILVQQVEGWAELLKHAGQTLLSDRLDSLPG
jgi:hypothetical protein